MLFQDRLRIGDRRQRRHQALQPVIWLAMAASEVDIWTAIIRVACVHSLVCTFACTIKKNILRSGEKRRSVG